MATRWALEYTSSEEAYMKNHTSDNLTSGQSSDNLSTVLGVVYPPGAGGGRLAGQVDWTLRFTLQPWRIQDGMLQEASLSLVQGVSKDELKQLMALLQPYHIIQALVRFTHPGQGELVRL